MNKGDNPLLVKVSEKGGGWSMFVGFDTKTENGLKFNVKQPKLAVDLDENSNNHGEAYNFGPSSDQNYPVSKLIDEISKYWDQVQWNDISKDGDHVHEAGLLKLNCDKALFNLGWHSTLQFEETVKMTVEWYKHYYQNQEKSMYDFTIDQIDEYTKLANLRGIAWASK